MFGFRVFGLFLLTAIQVASASSMAMAQANVGQATATVVVLEVDSTTSSIEGCFAGACEQSVVSGQLQVTIGPPIPDTLTAQATLDALDIMALDPSPLAGPLTPLSIAETLVADSVGAEGLVFFAALGPQGSFEFSSQNLTTLLDLSLTGPFVSFPFSLEGGFDRSLVDGPRAQLSLFGTISSIAFVPEPSTALLVGFGLFGLASRSRPLI